MPNPTKMEHTPRDYVELPIGQGIMPCFLATLERSLLNSKRPKRQIANQNLQVTAAEFSHFVQGNRRPPPTFIARVIEFAGQEGAPSATRSFVFELDQALIYGGYSPVFCKHLANPSRVQLLLTQTKSGLTIEPASESIPKDYDPDLYFLCRRPNIAVVRTRGIVDRGLGITEGTILLIERVADDNGLQEGDLVVFTGADNVAVATSFKRTKVKSTKNCSAKMTVFGRVILRFQLPPQSRHFPRRTPIATKTRQIESLAVGIAPFQDALLPVIGEELGFFHEEGLFAECKEIEWYNWSNFFGDNGHHILVSSVFSFVAHHRAHRDSDLVFAYPTCLFDRGFALLARNHNLNSVSDLCKQEGLNPNNLSSTDRGRLVRQVLEQIDNTPIQTIFKSDWAAQLFTLAKTYNLNLGVRQSFGAVQNVFITDSTRPTLVLRDLYQTTGVRISPKLIAKEAELFLGSLPQRFRLIEGSRRNEIPPYKELLEPQFMPAPYPVLGLVVRRDMIENPKLNILLRFLRVWFRIARCVEAEICAFGKEDRTSVQHGRPRLTPASASRIIARNFEQRVGDEGAKLTIAKRASDGLLTNEIVEAWSLERFPTSPREVEELFFCSPSPLWQQDWQRAEEYLRKASPEDTNAVNASAFRVDQVHKEYVKAYGLGDHANKTFKEAACSVISEDTEPTDGNEFEDR